jgi:predicted metal-dependent peptidase
MASSSPPETLAEALQRARIRLALSRPFLASAVLRLPLVAVDNGDWCPTAATDGYHVFYNPEWIGRLDAGSLRGLLAHEVLHVVFAHGERRQHRDHKRWNIACDHAINLLLLEQGFRLPRDGFADLSFRGLSAEQIYQRLPAQPLP